MKTILAVLLYLVMIGALNLGGVVWNEFVTAHFNKAPATMPVPRN